MMQKELHSNEREAQSRGTHTVKSRIIMGQSFSFLSIKRGMIDCRFCKKATYILLLNTLVLHVLQNSVQKMLITFKYESEVFNSTPLDKLQVTSGHSQLVENIWSSL